MREGVAVNDKQGSGHLSSLNSDQANDGGVDHAMGARSKCGPLPKVMLGQIGVTLGKFQNLPGPDAIELGGQGG
jgi:hypothetical protein